jgi:transcription initiation factor TFIID TATA-box-binding protein
MTQIKIENIVAYAQIADAFTINTIIERIPAFNYNPDEFSGLTMKLDDPKTAVLILPNGKAISTGAVKVEDAKKAILKVKDILCDSDIKVKPKIEVKIQNIVVSADFNKELHLSSISTGLVLENVTYAPEQFPGLIYKLDVVGPEIILFSSGKIVCTGTNNLEDASKAIDLMKEKLSSIGAL